MELFTTLPTPIIKIKTIQTISLFKRLHTMTNTFDFILKLVIILKSK